MSPTPNPSDRWRELLAGAGIKRASIAGSGLFKDAAVRCADAPDFLRRRGEDHCQIVVPDFGTIAGLFQIVSLEFAGEHNGEVTFELSLESAGALTFTAVSTIPACICNVVPAKAGTHIPWAITVAVIVGFILSVSSEPSVVMVPAFAGTTLNRSSHHPPIVKGEANAQHLSR